MTLEEATAGPVEHPGLAIYGEELAVMWEYHHPLAWNAAHTNEVAALLALLTPVAARAEWRPPTSGETALFVASQVAVLADIRTTLDIKNHPGGFEKNPVLGRHPSDAKILALGGLSMAVQAAAWYALPSPWRNVLSGVMLTVEIGMVANNVSGGAPPPGGAPSAVLYNLREPTSVYLRPLVSVKVMVTESTVPEQSAFGVHESVGGCAEREGGAVRSAKWASTAVCPLKVRISCV